MQKSINRPPDAARISILMTGVVSQAGRRAVKDFAGLGLSHPAARALMQMPGAGKIRCGALAALCGLDAAALSRVLRALGAKELITRRRSRKDQRAIEIKLTPKGKALARQCVEIDASRQSLMLQGAAGADVECFTGLLARMSGTLGMAPVAPARRGGDGAAA